MHVLVTADTIGGVWTYIRELVTGLVNRGVRVTLVSFGEIPAQRQCEWMERLPSLDFRPTGFQLEWMQEAEQDIELSTEYLASIVREVKPDLLHLNQYCYGSLDVDVPRIVVAHSDVVSWWVAVHGHEPNESRWMSRYREAVSGGLSGATAVVAPSHWMLNALCGYYGRPAHASVIYNGRNPNSLNPHVTKQEYVVSVGRLWDGGKQVSLLRQVDPPLPIHIAGAQKHPDGASHANSETLTKTRKLYYRGKLSEAQLRQVYARASAYVATSRYEPFGLAPLEAALSRCAILANDIPTFREIWGDTALYFRANDALDLQSALERLAADKALCLRYANLAYEHARKHYNAQDMVDKYLELYKTLVPAGARAA